MFYPYNSVPQPMQTVALPEKLDSIYDMCEEAKNLCIEVKDQNSAMAAKIHAAAKPIFDAISQVKEAFLEVVRQVELESKSEENMKNLCKPIKDIFEDKVEKVVVLDMKEDTIKTP
ncbi:unnamed protein product [Rhodiola kirilowii]